MIDLRSKDFTQFIGLGIIKFGLSRNAIRDILNEPFREFKRNEFAENTTDYYPSSMVFIEYDIDNNCNAIEIHKGADFIFNGTNIFSLSYKELLEVNKKTSANFEEDDSGITFHDLGFGVSIHDNEIETVVLFSKDYWK